jgi:hypothetical protein
MERPFSDWECERLRERTMIPKLTLDEILSHWFAEADGQPCPYTRDQLVGMMDLKVDDYRIAKDRLEDEAKRWAEYAREMTAEKQRCERQVERMKGFVLDLMAHYGVDVLRGEKFQVKRTSSERTRLLTDEVTDEHLTAWPDFVRTRHEFRLDEIKRAIKDGIDVPFAVIEEHPSVRFGAVKKER